MKINLKVMINITNDKNNKYNKFKIKMKKNYNKYKRIDNLYNRLRVKKTNWNKK